MVPAAIRDMEKLLVMAQQLGFSSRLLSMGLKISPRQLRRYTHELYGCSPQNWLDQQRMRLAADLLKEHRCVKTVAFHLGFKRPSHFSREFKLLHGLSPTAYIGWIDRQSLSGPRDDSVPPSRSPELWRRIAGAV